MKFVLAPAGLVIAVGLSVVLGLATLVSTVASASTSTDPSDDGPSTEPAGPALVAATSAGSAAEPTAPVQRSETTVVRGIRVHHSLASRLAALLADAEADGMTLGGWGWRDPQAQIRLRRQHCGASEYAIWEMPSGQCSPPTARPGRSQHERGLAIDFTCNGAPMAGTACFRWLQTNAVKYGLFNLPSEPWHWSTSGR